MPNMCDVAAGNKEGVYGWVAANYASGALQVSLTLHSSDAYPVQDGDVSQYPS